MPRKRREEVEEVEEDKSESDICKTCKGDGAVPSIVIDGRVDKWKDCPDCVKCPDCKDGKTNEGKDCPRCFKGRIPIASTLEEKTNE